MHQARLARWQRHAKLVGCATTHVGLPRHGACPSSWHRSRLARFTTRPKPTSRKLTAQAPPAAIKARPPVERTEVVFRTGARRVRRRVALQDPIPATLVVRPLLAVVAVAARLPCRKRAARRTARGRAEWSTPPARGARHQSLLPPSATSSSWR